MSPIISSIHQSLTPPATPCLPPKNFSHTTHSSHGSVSVPLNSSETPFPVLQLTTRKTLTLEAEAMAIVTGDRYLESLVKFVENQAEKLIEGTLVLKLNPVGLRYVQSRLEALAELESLLAGAPVDYLRAYVSDLGDHRALEQLRRILRLIPSLKVVSVLPPPSRDPTPLYLLPFGRLKVLELRGCDLSTSSAKGLLELRFTLEKLICHNSTDALRHVFASRIAEIKDSAQWNRLGFVSCACNSLVLMDESLHLLSVVETLDLSRNKFAKVDNLRKCTKLKHLDLGFNSLRSILSLREVSCQIVKLVLRNNALTTLRGIENMKSLEGLDLSYNIISNYSELEILAGLPSLENLWLEGNPICCARWFRAQVFSFFSDPEKIKLDDKVISASEFWQRQIIVASRQKQPASFGFYSPAKDDAELEGSINTKRVGDHLLKRISRLVNIENDEQNTYVCSDHDSVSCDIDAQSKDGKANTDEEAEIEDLMKRIEFMKKEHSVQWLQEFREWMNHSSNHVRDGSKFTNTIARNKKEIHAKGENKDENLGETSRYNSDSVQLSGDESSTIILESETSFADTSTVVSAQRYFDRIGQAASNFFMGHAGGDQSVLKNGIANQDESRFLNDEGTVSANTGEMHFSLLADSRGYHRSGKNMSARNVISPSTAICDILDSRSSLAYPGSPPHYQEDILHRRQNLEEEFLQLSAESFSVASSDSNTSCSEDDSAELGHSMNHIDQSLLDKSSGNGLNSFSLASDREDAGGTYRDKFFSLKQNGIHSLKPCEEEHFNSVEDRDLEVSAHACSCSFSSIGRDDETINFLDRETNWLDNKKRRRKPRTRMISLPEEEDAHGETDSSKKSGDIVEIGRSDTEAEGKETCCTGELWRSVAIRNNGDCTTPNVLEKYYPEDHSGFNKSSDQKNDYVEKFFNSRIGDAGVKEISLQYMQCDSVFLEESSYYEREVAILRSSEQRLYILLILKTSDGSGTSLETLGCQGVGDVKEVFVGLGLQLIRVCFGGNTAYLFLTRCTERSRELLHVLGFFDSSGSKDYHSLTSLEQTQINLFEEHICRGLKINIFQYSMVHFWHNNLKEDVWLSRSLFVLDDHLLVCMEDLRLFGRAADSFSPCYFSLDLCCAVVDVSKMVIDPMNDLCVILSIECASEFPPEKSHRIEEDAFLKKTTGSDQLTWKLKWFSEEGLLNFVALLKAIYAQATSSSLVVRSES